MPFRTCSIHWCADNPTAGKLSLSVAFPFHKRQVRARIRIHIGSHQECQHKLMTFGIQPFSIPFNEKKGNLPVYRHLEWIQHHQAIKPAMKQGKIQCQHDYLNKKDVKYAILSEDDNDKMDHIYAVRIVPKPQDVLFGTGISHPGNNYFRFLIMSQMDCYNNADSNFDKTLLSLQVISHVKESGGRFLKMIGKDWYVAKDEEIRKKVSSSFRNQRRVTTKIC